MASSVNLRDFRVRVCDAPEALLARFIETSRYLNDRQATRLLRTLEPASVIDSARFAGFGLKKSV